MNQQKTLPAVIQTGPVASTSTHAQQLLAQGRSYPELTVWASNRQTDGRGQGDHRWESAPGRNVTCSILLRPTFLPAKDQFCLSECIALAVSDLVNEFTPDVRIKWPNDIYVGDRKVAGILTEHTLAGRTIQHTIIGIGLNVNQETFLSDAPNPVSLCQLTGRTYPLHDLTERLQQHVAARYEALRSGWAAADMAEKLRAEYLGRMYRFGEWHRFRSGTETFDGRISGVTSQGYLEIGRHDGTVRHFDLKEVQFLSDSPMAHDLRTG